MPDYEHYDTTVEVSCPHVPGAFWYLICPPRAPFTLCFSLPIMQRARVAFKSASFCVPDLVMLTGAPAVLKGLVIE